MQAKMIILDRDGVINHQTEDDVRSVDEWDPIPGSIEAISRLKKAGYLVTIASNQSGIARGLYSEADLEAMHDKLHKLLAIRGVAIDGIFYCPHGPEANCICRDRIAREDCGVSANAHCCSVARPALAVSPGREHASL